MDYREPRWWTRPWGWISFFPHEPDFSHPPFHSLLYVPHRLHRFSNDSRYSMPPNVAASWEQLDRDISFVTHLLQLHYGAAALRPMNPRGFGYSKPRSHLKAVMRSIFKSRDWFCVWIALLSYLIACAETVENDLEPYPFLAKKHWALYLLEKGVERTFLDALLTSFAFCFSPKIVRSGVFLHIPPKRRVTTTSGVVFAAMIYPSGIHGVRTKQKILASRSWLLQPICYKLRLHQSQRVLPEVSQTITRKQLLSPPQVKVI